MRQRHHTDQIIIERRKHRFLMICILVVAALLCLALFFSKLSLEREFQEMDLKRIALETEIEAEKARTERIESRREYMESEEFIRDAARDYLGLVESGDTVYRRRD